MPNWVKNELFVIGSKKNRDAVKALLANAEPGQGESNWLDFNKVVRMPDGYFWTDSPAQVVDHYAKPEVTGNDPLAWQWSKERNCNLLTEVEAQIMDHMRALGCVDRQWFEAVDRNRCGEMRLMQSMLSVVLKRLHGFECWHGWSCAKWGTKWNAHHVKVRDDNRVLRYHFSTAWSSPKPFVYALGKQCPDVTLVLESCDPDMGWSESVCVRKTHYVWRYDKAFPPPGTSELSVGSSTPPESND